MKKLINKILAVTFLAMTALLISCGKKAPTDTDVIEREPISPTDSSTYTLMVYMIGSDLEAAGAAATNDMAEMMANEIDFSRMNVVVYTGGSPKWHSDIADDTNGVYKLTENGFEEVTTYELTSMGDPENLTKFLNYAYSAYPADIYSLILWDHGNGPIIGYGMDKKFNNDSLTLPEIEQALSASPFGPDNRLAFIGFDACLMSSLELANTVDDYADIMIASQETEPSYGWNYDFIEKCLELNTNELAGAILDSYIEYDKAFSAKNPLFSNEVTLAAIDLAYASLLEERVNTLFRLASSNVGGNFVILAESRLNTRGFGRATTGSEYDLVDLVDLTEAMSDIYPDECAAINSCLEKMVIDNRNNTVRSCGLSLYYPYYNKNYYEKSWKTEYSKLGILPDYITYLERYDQVWLGTDMASFFDDTLTPSEKSKGVYSVQLSAEQLERIGNVGYYILRKQGENDYQALYYGKNTEVTDSSINAYFDNKIIYFKDNYNRMYIPYMVERDTIDDITTYSMFPTMSTSTFSYKSDYYDEYEELATELQITLNNSTGDVKIIGLYEYNNGDLKSGKKTPVDINSYPVMFFQNIMSRLLTRNADGRIQQYGSWTKDGSVTFYYTAIADGYSFNYEPLYDDGNEYFLMFDIHDVQGNAYGTELLPIALDPIPESDPIEYDTVDWTTGDEVTISDKNNVKVSLVRNNLNNSIIDNYYVKVENNNTFSISFDMQNMVLNDSYSIFNIDAPGSSCIEAKSTAYISIDALNQLNIYGGVTDIHSLSFSHLVKNLKTYGRLYDYQYTTVNISTYDKLYTLADDNNINSSVLFEDSITRVELIERADAYSGRASYLIKATNFTDQSLTVYVGGYTFNDTFEYVNYNNSSYNCDTLSIAPHSYKYQPLYEIESALYAGDIDDIEKMTVTVAYDLDDQHETEYIFDTNPNVGLIWQPFLGATFSEQLLADTDDVRITLLAAGNTLSTTSTGLYLSDSIRFVVRIDNKTDKPIPADIGLLIVNGITVEATDFSATSTSTIRYIPAGMSSILVKNYDTDCFEDNYINTIENLSIQIMTSINENTSSFGIEGGSWYKVTLSSHMNENATAPRDGKLVYTDEWIDLYLLSIDTEVGFLDDTIPSYFKWRLYAVNKTNKNIRITDNGIYINDVAADSAECDYPSYFIGINMLIGANSSAYETISVYNSNDLPGPAPKLTANLILTNQGGNELYYGIDELLTFE